MKITTNRLVSAWLASIAFSMVIVHGVATTAPVVASQASTQKDATFVITAKLQKGFVMRFEMTQVEGPGLEIYEADLPWGVHKSRLVVAVTARGTVMNQDLYIDDSGPRAHKMTKGSTLRGDVMLAMDFPAIPNVVRHEDVIIFWSYLPRTTDGRRLQRTGGWMLIPKGSM